MTQDKKAKIEGVIALIIWVGCSLYFFRQANIRLQSVDASMIDENTRQLLTALVYMFIGAWITLAGLFSFAIYGLRKEIRMLKSSTENSSF